MMKDTEAAYLDLDNMYPGKHLKAGRHRPCCKTLRWRADGGSTLCAGLDVNKIGIQMILLLFLKITTIYISFIQAKQKLK